MPQGFVQTDAKGLFKTIAIKEADKNKGGCPFPLPLAQNRMFLMFLLILFLFGFRNE
jgi:hypothetical protein